MRSGTSSSAIQTDKALFYLEKAYEGREHDLVFLDCWPMFDKLRGDKRFEALRRRIGLSEMN